MRVVSWGALVGLAVFVISSGVRAQCTMDTDCKGERICEQGKCTGPVGSAPAPVQPSPEPAAAVSSPAPPDPAPPAAPAWSEPQPRFFEEDAPRKPKKRIGRPGLMATGIVLTALGPTVLVVGALTTSSCRSGDPSDSCEQGQARLVGFLLASAALIGVGVPLIVIGAKRVPVRQVVVGPWLAPRQAGLRLHLAL